MTIIHGINASLSRRLASALAFAALGACVTSDPEDVATIVAPAASATHAPSDIDALDDATEAWRSTCDRSTLDGLCLEPAATAAPLRCSRRLLGYAVVPRSPAAEAAAETLDGLVGDIDELTRGPHDPDEVQGRGEAALARFDAEIERVLTNRLAEREQVGDWIHDGGQLIEALAAMKRFGSPEITTRAALRTAIVFAGSHDQLADAPMPAGVEAAEYCAAMAEHTEPLAEQARKVAQWCVDDAARKAYDGPVVGQCRALVADFAMVQGAPLAPSNTRAEPNDARVQ